MSRGSWFPIICVLHKQRIGIIAKQKTQGITEMSSMKSNLAEQTVAEVDANPDAKANEDLPALSVISNKSNEKARRISWRSLVAVLGLGLASSSLYLLLFEFADTLTALSVESRAGASYYAIVPIIIALVFSAVHGAFTARFWDLLGLRARTH